MEKSKLCDQTKFTEKLISYDEASQHFPKTVYKYRSWNKKLHRSILLERQVYFSPPNEFSDKFDSKNFIRYDLLTHQDILSKYYWQARETHPHASSHELFVIAAENFSSSHMHNQAWIRQQQEIDFIEYNKRIGILSLTENCGRSELWSEYADNHSGFCVGFDPKIMFAFLGGGMPVEYCSDLPIILPHPWEDRKLAMIKQVFCKLDKYQHEEEYRAQKFSYTPLSKIERTITLPAEAYSEVIFGARISKKHKDYISRIVGRELPSVELKQAIIKNGTIEITTV